MKITEIYYNEQFEAQFIKLPQEIQKKSVKTEKLLRENPFYPSLRLHKLKGKLNGLWSISINNKYRIIFKPLTEGEILFVSIGLHAIYEG